MSFAEQLASACLKVFHVGDYEEQVTFPQLMEGVPAGFWSEVLQELIEEGVRWPDTPQELTERTIESFWLENKAAIREIMDSQLRDGLSSGSPPERPHRFRGGEGKNPGQDPITTSVRIRSSHIPQATKDIAGRERVTETVELDKAFLFEHGIELNDLDNVGEEASEPVSMDKILILMTESEARLVEFVEKKIEDALQSRAGDIRGHGRKGPPAPPRTGRYGKKFAGSKGDIRVRVDRVLWTLFQEEISRHNGNASAAMDTILWHYFGKPSLSFQDGQDP